VQPRRNSISLPKNCQAQNKPPNPQVDEFKSLQIMIIAEFMRFRPSPNGCEFDFVSILAIATIEGIYNNPTCGFGKPLSLIKF
jgi:hypothetical protein